MMRAVLNEKMTMLPDNRMSSGMRAVERSALMAVCIAVRSTGIYAGRLVRPDDRA